LAKYEDSFLGTIGHFGCISFHETKNITCGEGGALLVNDERYIERAEIIREKGTNRSKFFRGQVDKYTWCDLGSSFLSSDILSSFLYTQLINSLVIIEKRRTLWYLYHENLKNNQNFKIIEDLEHNYHNAHMFYLLFENLEQRTSFQNYLKNNNIISTFHYIPLHSSVAGKKYGRQASTMAATDNISDCLLRLPMWIGMDIEYILKQIKAYKIS
jgi:dTDP-4-amino-4,6-dideoxygalactose transaminase